MREPDGEVRPHRISTFRTTTRLCRVFRGPTLTFEWSRRSTVAGVSVYTIGEAADRTGFSASTLRYYEGIGLAAPSARTDAGYRLYDDDGLARLAFVARAKQLGCSLDEIIDLVGLWDGGACGPVQRRLHDLVTAKLTAAERQIAELTVLAGQLRDVAAVLDGPPIDGACGPACACSTIAPPTRRRHAGAPT